MNFRDALSLGLFTAFGLLLQLAAAGQPHKVIDAETPAEPMRTVKALELDGNGSFVELPPGSFTNLAQITVEGWVKWETFGSMSRFFDITLEGCSLNLHNRGNTSDLQLERCTANEQTIVNVPGLLQLGRWTHIAAVMDQAILKLFIDGALISTNTGRSFVSTAGIENRNYLGRSNFKVVYTSDSDFRGGHPLNWV